MNTTISTLRPIEYRAGAMRDYVFPFMSAAFVFLLPFSWILAAFLIVGQAHFFMAYLYQYRGGKMNARYIVFAVALALLAFGYFSLDLGVVPILMIAGLMFSAHFALDEFTLHGESLTLGRIMTIAGFALLFCALVTGYVFPSLFLVAPVAGALLCVVIVWRLWYRRDAPPSPAERYLWLIGAILFFFAVALGLPEKILGIILLLHFANWYVGYGRRLKEGAKRVRRYWTEVAASLAGSSVLFILYAVLGTQLLAYLFDLEYYYAWAAAHITLSFVTATYRLA